MRTNGTVSSSRVAGAIVGDCTGLGASARNGGGSRLEAPVRGPGLVGKGAFEGGAAHGASLFFSPLAFSRPPALPGPGLLMLLLASAPGDRVSGAAKPGSTRLPFLGRVGTRPPFFFWHHRRRGPRRPSWEGTQAAPRDVAASEKKAGRRLQQAPPILSGSPQSVAGGRESRARVGRGS